MPSTDSRSFFTRMSDGVGSLAGRAGTFSLALLLILGWLITGPLFGFSSTWQLVINTVTTIITFLMVFLIQGTQNRDAEAVQVKLDELLRVTEGAHNVLLDLEKLDQRELDRIRATYIELASAAREALRAGTPDTGVPDVGHPQ
jgi:low affinity Fe/Cu permease